MCALSKRKLKNRELNFKRKCKHLVYILCVQIGSSLTQKNYVAILIHIIYAKFNSWIRRRERKRENGSLSAVAKFSAENIANWTVLRLVPPVRNSKRDREIVR